MANKSRHTLHSHVKLVQLNCTSMDGSFTCGDAAAEEIHPLQGCLGVDLDSACRVEHGVLGEGGRVKEVVDRLARA